LTVRKDAHIVTKCNVFCSAVCPRYNGLTACVRLLGVAMTVGRLEKPPYDERVLQMLFDVTKWEEEQAYKWWQENSYRYVGAADENGKMVVAFKPTSLLKSATGWKVPSAVERAQVEADDEASAAAACAKLRKPFDALDPNFTGDALERVP